MGPIARRSVLATLGLLALLVFGHVSRQVASLVRPPLDFDVGPSTGRYLDGFTESEERLPVTFRWTRERATMALPVTGTGQNVRMKIRLARFLEGNARVRVFVDGKPSGGFSARSGRFRTVELPLELGAGASSLSFLVDDPDPERLGIAIDWMRFEKARWRLPASTIGPPLLVAGVFGLTVALGFTIPVALGLGSIVALAQAFWFARDPMAMAHVHGELAAGALVSTALVALVYRHGSHARWVPLLYLLGFSLKGAALFHPSYFYPDVRLHRRHLEVMRVAEGGLVERSIAAQKAVGTAYPRQLAGRDYAFPYSPVFYLPFTLLERDARGIESIMKHTGLWLAALELPLVFLLASYLLGARPAIWAALVTAFLPPVMSRLLFAQWPTLAGHLLDVVAIALAARMVKAPEERRPFVLYGLSGFLACLTYISSLINLSLFTALFSLVERKRALRLLVMWGAIGLATVVLLYGPFVRIFFVEALPALAAGTSEAAAVPGTGVLGALGRVHLFFGLGFPALAFAGFVLTRREPAVFRLLAIYLLTFVALLLLRSASGAFKDLKELVFVGPFIAIATGASLETLSARGRMGRLAALLVAIGLIAFGLGKLSEYTAIHTNLAGIE